MFWYPLMKDCITNKDKKELVDFITTTDRFTNGPKVREFENAWSNWLGCKHSLFVSSGSTANFLLIASIKEKNGLKNGSKVLVPAMTWMTSVSPILQLGLTPVFCDVNPNTLSFDLDHMKKISLKHPDMSIVFVTHLMGNPSDVDGYKEIFPNAVFLEDVCESHGSVYKNKKAGTLSSGSTFSFYFGHHMTTIEGGMVCTDDPALYNLMRLKRSHGLAREATLEKFEQYKKTHPNIHPQFMFVTDGYNFRSTDLNAVLGLSQIERLDYNVSIRRDIFKKFLELSEKYDFYYVPNVEGNSCYCLPFVCKDVIIKNKLEKHLVDSGVETRPLIAGNLLKHPFLKKYSYPLDLGEESLNVDSLHERGFFIGNSHLVTEGDMRKIDTLIHDFAEREGFVL